MHKFFLALVTINGLLSIPNSVLAAPTTPTTSRQITSLSQTIAKLINLDDRSLVEQAINRALLAQNTRDSKSTDSVTPNDVSAGGISINPTEVSKPVTKDNITTPRRPFINGRIQNPQTEPSSNSKPIINGIIFNPNSR